MTAKEKFAILAQTGRFTATELCRDFGVSRKTGHKHLKRYGAEEENRVNPDKIGSILHPFD